MRFTCQCLNIEVDAIVTELSEDDFDYLNLNYVDDDFFKLPLVLGQHTNVLDFISPIRDSLSDRRSRRKKLQDTVEHRCYAILPELVRLQGSSFNEWMIMECFLCQSRIFAVTVRPGVNALSPLDILLSRAEVIADPDEQERRELLNSTSVWQFYLDAMVPWTTTTSNYEFSYHVKEHKNTKSAIKELMVFVQDCEDNAVDNVVQSEKDQLVDMLTTKYVILATDTRNNPDNYNICKRLSGESKKRPRSQTVPSATKPPLQSFEVDMDPFDLEDEVDERPDDESHNSSWEDIAEDVGNDDCGGDGEGDEFTEEGGIQFSLQRTSLLAASAPIDAPMMRRGRTDTRQATYLPPTEEFLLDMTAEEQLYAMEKANYMSRSATELTVGIFGVEGPPSLQALRESAVNSRRLLNARVEAQICGEDPDAVCAGDSGNIVDSARPPGVVHPANIFHTSSEEGQGNGDSI